MFLHALRFVKVYKPNQPDFLLTLHLCYSVIDSFFIKEGLNILQFSIFFYSVFLQKNKQPLKLFLCFNLLY